MRRATHYELIGGFDAEHGSRQELCVDWEFSDNSEYNRADFNVLGCSCHITNYTIHGDDTVTCNQWLNWDGGAPQCPVHEWVYQDYRDHVTKSIYNMRNPVPHVPSFPIVATRMK